MMDIFSSLVTATKSFYFQTLYFLPVVKAQKVIAYHLVNYFTIPKLFQYSSNTTYLLLKCDYHVISKKMHGYQFFTDTPIDITCLPQ